MWARAPKVALVAAVVPEVIAVEAYYAADVVLRSADRSSLTSTSVVAWLVLEVATGVIFGPAGAYAHSGLRSVRTVACALLPSVFVSEGSMSFSDTTLGAPTNAPMISCPSACSSDSWRQEHWCACS